jgi:hypothetical protein
MRKMTFHTLESLMARTEEVGDCKEWQGYFANASPGVKHGGKMTTVRKLIRILQGKERPPGTMTSVSCGNHRCVHPDHLIDRDATAHARVMASNVDYASPTRTAKLQKKAEPRRKISDEGVQAALGDPRTCQAVADAHGVSKSLISKIRRGQSHRQTNAAANPWAGLMR